MDQRFRALQRQIRWLQLVCGALGLLLCAATTTALVGRQYLQVRGVTIVDESGKPRILIGAPPEIGGRKRIDAQTASIVVLGPQGQDRVIVGEEPNPLIAGKPYPRIGAAYGMLIHDQTGQERGGISNFDIGRSVISLDRQNQDAVEMIENDRTGFAGMTVNYARPFGQYAEAIRVGTRGEEAWWALNDGVGTERAGVHLTGARGAPSLRMAPAAMKRDTTK